jgi:hypothetical protein
MAPPYPRTDRFVRRVLGALPNTWDEQERFRAYEALAAESIVRSTVTFWAIAVASWFTPKNALPTLVVIFVVSLLAGATTGRYVRGHRVRFETKWTLKGHLRFVFLMLPLFLLSGALAARSDDGLWRDGGFTMVKVAPSLLVLFPIMLTKVMPWMVDRLGLPKRLLGLSADATDDRSTET